MVYLQRYLLIIYVICLILFFVVVETTLGCHLKPYIESADMYQLVKCQALPMTSCCAHFSLEPGFLRSSEAHSFSKKKAPVKLLLKEIASLCVQGEALMQTEIGRRTCCTCLLYEVCIHH